MIPLNTIVLNEGIVVTMIPPYGETQSKGMTQKDTENRHPMLQTAPHGQRGGNTFNGFLCFPLFCITFQRG